MFGLRSARGRAVLASAVLIVVLAAVAIVAVLRVREHQHRLLVLEDTAITVASLEDARTQLYCELAALSGLVFSDDPTLADDYREAAASLEQDLILVRAEAAAAGRADYVATLDDLTERVGSFNQTANAVIPLLLQGNPETRTQLVVAAVPDIRAEIEAIVATLDQLAEGERAELTTEGTTASQAADITSWIVIGFGGTVLLIAAGVVVVTIVSMVRPLASLRASTRAITSGNLEERAKVFGPEEVASVARDFNEMTDALLAKTKEYIDTANLSTDIVAKVDEHGRWAFLNDAACQFFGKPREELLGTYPTDLVHPEDVEATVQLVRDGRTRTEPVWGFVNRQLTPMGIRVVEWNGCSLFDEDGRYAGIQITGRDITERKQMEQSLRDSERGFRLIAESATDVIWTTDLSFRYTYVSPSVTRMRGYSVEEVMASRLRDTLTPSSLEIARKMVAEDLAQDENRGNEPFESRTLEVELNCKDGSTVWTETTVTFLRDENGRPVGLLGVSRDITERKQMGEALAAKTKEYIDTANLTGDLIARLDKHGNWAFLNDAACQFFGKPREELVGTDSRASPHPEDAELSAQVIREARATKELVRGFVNRQLTPMGTRVVEWNGCPLFDAEGQYAGIQITGRDITERKQAEDTLRQLEERYRALFEEAPAMYLICRDQGGTPVVSDCNELFLSTLGYTRAEVLERPMADFYTSKSRAELLEGGGFQRALAGRFVVEERQLLTRDGRVVEAVLRAVPEIDPHGHILGTRAMYIDITDRKRAEEELQSSQERLKILFEAAPDAYYLHDLEGNIVDGNRAAEELLGYKREELIGKNMLEVKLLLPEQIPEVAECLAQNAVGRAVGPNEFTLIGKHGNQIEVEVRSFPVKIKDQTLVLGVARDISGRKRADEALRESEARYRLLAENASDLIWTMDMNLRYTYMSPSITRMRGYTVEEVVGSRVTETMTPASIEAVRKAFVEEMAKGRMDKENLFRERTLELEMYCKDGSTIWTEVKLTFLRNSDGWPIGIMGVTRDISERKRTEEALRQSEARYRLLTENTSDLIWTMDLGLRYTYMSPAITRMRGYTAEEIMDLPITETMTPTSVEVARKSLAERLALERVGQGDPSGVTKVELEMYCKDGSTIWTEMGMTWLRDSDDEPVGILGVTRDISERKKAEAERERLNAELEVRAITDGLTGLYDHAHFYQRLAEEIDRSKRYKHGFAVVMMDVDDFKRFNDSRGHQVGDEMLRLVADCIRWGVRSSDIAFRYGGDEFAAILPHADTSKAKAAVSRINVRITKNLKQIDGGAATRLSLSAGVACFPDDGTTADVLVRLADAALYNAKWVARARDIMGQREDIQSLISALVNRRGGVNSPADGAIFRPEALHEQQARIVSSVASSIAVALKDAGVSQALEDPDLQVLATVGAAAEIKDRYIRGHPERTSEGAAALAEEMGLSSEQVRNIKIAGLLHDIGKVTVSESILNKPGKLTKREFASIKDHPIVGATLVSQVRGFEHLIPIVRHHHERFDGKGYPDGLTGEEIPLEARIMSVMDVFDALTHERSYREGLSSAEATTELERGAGTQFDPAVVEAFLTLVKTRGDQLTAFAEAADGNGQPAAARAAVRGKR